MVIVAQCEKCPGGPGKIMVQASTGVATTAARKAWRIGAERKLKFWRMGERYGTQGSGAAMPAIGCWEALETAMRTARFSWAPAGYGAVPNVRELFQKAAQPLQAGLFFDRIQRAVRHDVRADGGHPAGDQADRPGDSGAAGRVILQVSDSAMRAEKSCSSVCSLTESCAARR